MTANAANFQWKRFFAKLAASRSRALLLDYDGTLAPFRVERDQAHPHPSLRDALQRICHARRTRVVVISGRALCDLIPLLHIHPTPELWGCHGWERQLPNGDYHGPDLDPDVRAILEEARRQMTAAGWDGRCESKPTSLAVHWRGLDPSETERIRAHVTTTWSPLARKPGLALHEFDGGLEMRATGRDKGYAVAQILRELPTDAIVAYAGDDLTDEDAFRALVGRGLSILVRPAYRETAADLWLRSPDQWTRFLNDWMLADTEGG
jgi:trehalose 6-phosphate phosphatase